MKIRTGDSFLDVNMNYYSYLALKENIEFVVSGRLTEEMHLEMFDITTLMGNILQNAVEATLKAANPKIRVELIEHKKELFIVVSNSVTEKIDTQKGFSMTSKKDKENHGFGQKNIVATVEKYHGEYYMESIVENGEAFYNLSHCDISKELIIVQEDRKDEKELEVLRIGMCFSNSFEYCCLWASKRR